MQIGAETLQLMHGIMSVIAGAPYDISVAGCKSYEENHGKITCEISGTVQLVGKLSEDENDIAREYQHIANRNETMKKCLQLFSYGSLSIANMYKIYELIKADCEPSNRKQRNCEHRKCEISDFLNISSAEIDRFTSNANHPAYHEDSRHAVMKGRSAAEEKKMDNKEMQEFIRRLFKLWVKRIADQ